MSRATDGPIESSPYPPDWCRAVLEAMPDMVFRSTRDGIALDYKPGGGIRPIVPPEQFLGRPAREVLPAEVADLIERTIKRTLETRQCQTIEYQLTIDGQVRHHEGRMVAYGQDDVLLVVRDITGRKRGEQALRESEAKYQMLFEASIDAVFLETLDGQVLDCNAAACKMHGFTKAELVTKHVRDLVPEDIARRLPDFVDLELRQGGMFVEAFGRRSDGSLFPTEVSTRIVNIEGRPLVIVYVRNITERRKAEAALRESEARLRQVIDLVPHMLFAKNRHGRFILANRAVAEAHGTTPEQMIGKTHPELDGAQPEYRQYLKDDLEVIETGRPRFVPEEDFTTIDGQVRILQTTKIPYIVSGSVERAVLGLAVDITDRKRAEQEREQLAAQLRQAQKMEALGKLAGGIAHDFNNLLTVISGCTEVALAHLGGKPKADDLAGARAALEQIQQAGERAAGMTRQLLTFSRKHVTRLEILDPNRIVSDMEKLLRRIIGEDVAMVLALAPGLKRVRADANQLEQVVMNLVINARDAMPAGGRLSIATSNVDLNESYAARHVGAHPGPHIVIAVRDTGTGMGPQTLSHIFEPFFTTKPVGKGTGLGLATAYGIVTQAGGHITVSSRVGHGTTFKVCLPAVEEAVHPAGDLPKSQDGQGEETILLCEDDDLVRRLACRVLESAGYIVLDAVDGRHALEVARQHDGPIDLLVTDLIMPEMNGQDLARALKAQRPDLQVLFISGYASDLLGPHPKCEEAIEFLAKPFRPPDLLERVGQILDRSQKRPG